MPKYNKAQYLSNKFFPYKKPNGGNDKKDDNYSDFDDESEHGVNLGELLLPLITPALLPKIQKSNISNEKIFRKNNHIYFRTEVTQKNVDILIQHINSYKEEVSQKRRPDGKKCKTVKPIFLHICSDGGSVHAGYIAYDYIKMSKIPIHTVAEGMVASMATTICMAGKIRYMLPSAFMLVHQLRAGIKGTFSELCDEHDNLQKVMDYDVEIYHRECRGKITHEQIREILKHEGIIDFKKCLEYGFVDKEYTGQQ